MMQGTYFFSFRSPYSWLASIGLKRLIDRQDTLDLVPFFEPDPTSLKQLQEKGGEFHYVAMSEAKHRYILSDVKRLCTQFGVSHAWPIDTDPWWEPSHLGFIKAQELGVGLSYFWAVYDSRWGEGEDISKPDTIEQLCRRASIDAGMAQEIAQAHQDPDTRQKGVDALYRLYREDIFGVPMFVKRRSKYWGLDRVSDFLDALETEGSEWVDLPIQRDYPLDFDHAGGCG